jgi:hypothetical protein
MGNSSLISLLTSQLRHEVLLSRRRLPHPADRHSLPRKARPSPAVEIVLQKDRARLCRDRMEAMLSEGR